MVFNIYNFYNRCGLRGGYTDMHNVPTPMKEAILKLKGLEICPNVIGQISVTNHF